MGFLDLYRQIFKVASIGARHFVFRVLGSKRDGRLVMNHVLMV